MKDCSLIRVLACLFSYIIKVESQMSREICSAFLYIVVNRNLNNNELWNLKVYARCLVCSSASSKAPPSFYHGPLLEAETTVTHTLYFFLHLSKKVYFDGKVRRNAYNIPWWHSRFWNVSVACHKVEFCLCWSSDYPISLILTSDLASLSWPTRQVAILIEILFFGMKGLNLKLIIYFKLFAIESRGILDILA